MIAEDIERVAALIRQRNDIDRQISAVIGRPVVSGHLAEWLASQVFDIDLEVRANTRAIDGVFRSGPLRGRSVNIKGYGKQESMLDMTEAEGLDFYLVLTGPPADWTTSAAATRPWCVDHVYLFDAPRLLGRLRARPQAPKIGVATSVAAQYWREAEIYPAAVNPLLALTAEQAAALDCFRSAPAMPDEA
ncbi:hypothetical protein [Glycomyces salinus]|uniref:hypothetical protein n=1 Tax=Glycomyces salinus TaxID=980294 RepID=UPI0018EACFC5|nr:hypothetical protein [Glycomyces salinus]